MVVVMNPLDDIVTILGNYDITNADSITPTIAKIYTKPKNKEPRPNEDFIYVYSELTTKNAVGIGMTTQSEVIESIKIDIRSRPAQTNQSTLVSDTHARKVLTEVERILHLNINNPSTNYHYLNPFVDITDLSDGMRGIFRYVLKINLTNFSKTVA